MHFRRDVLSRTSTHPETRAPGSQFNPLREQQGQEATTENRAQVNPEERALQVAGARTPSAQVGADRNSNRAQQDRANDNAKPSFYDSGRILGRISRLYGYSFLLSGIVSLFVSGISSLPLTKWDDEEGVPRADVALVMAVLFLWLSGAVSRDQSALASAEL